jgi:hypothetical protein
MDDGHRLILWSVREGQLLDDAVEWCRQRGVEFYAVNQNFEGDVPGDGNSSYSRKLKVQLFIDDRNIGGLPDWGVMYELIRRRITYAQYLREQQTMTDATPRPKKKSWWKL